MALELARVVNHVEETEDDAALYLIFNALETCAATKEFLETVKKEKVC